MTTNQLLLLCIILFPLLGAILNGFFLRNCHRHINTLVATLAVVASFIASCLLVFGPIKNGLEIKLDLFTWITLSSVTKSDFNLSFGLLADRLSGVMLLVITGVGSLIHLYSGEYMSHEKGVYRFFSYLNLFIFSMLILVLGANMPTTFLGWEGVGFCSYLLIGYWYEGEANAAAGMKAFIANRVGDFGFIIAMFLAYMLYGTLEYVGANGLNHAALLHANTILTTHSTEIMLLGFAILLAVTGKSAQIPLYVWLPDAMAGPTPVSALIHAATMVTAGIYFMARTSFLLVQSSTVMYAIALIGALTALFAATIAFTQNDIKKVLAYSTVSQLGFMVLACGVGAFQFGVAHLVTHAFFKGLLFLGAGSVIYALHHEQDVTKMGGLFEKMKITGLTFVIGVLAIIGFPLFSGFMSKDEILYNALTGPFARPEIWAIAVVAAFCTAFYMTRVLVLAFFGKYRGDPKHFAHLKENNWFITLPLLLLAVLSAVGGIITVPAGISHLFGVTGENLITTWLAPVLEPAELLIKLRQIEISEHSASLEYWLMAFSTAGVLISATFAYYTYRNGPDGGNKYAKKLGFIYTLIFDKWRIDELYNYLFISPLQKTASFLSETLDKVVIEGAVNGIPKSIRNCTEVLSSLQSGLLRSAIKTIFVGILIIFILLYAGVA